MTAMRRLAMVFLVFLVLLSGCAKRHPQLGGLEKEQFMEMAGQMILVGFRGLQLKPEDPVMLDAAAGRIGGVVLFSRDVALDSPVRNVRSPEQVRELVSTLQSESNIPLLVAVDQEGGRVARFSPEHGFPPTRSAQELGEEGNPEITRQAARKIGETLSSVGCNLDLAPVVDVNVTPDNPAIGKLGRSFSADPEEVGRQGLAFVRGLHEAGVLSSLKHFPGHGSAWNDSHLGMVDITNTWSEKELVPFTRIMEAGETDAVMTAHVFNARLDAEHPATLSYPIIDGILRKRLGFDGVVFSDDMQMHAITDHYNLKEAVTLAVNAGVDMLLFGNNLSYDPGIAEEVQDILLAQVLAGAIPVERIQESYARVMELKSKLAALNGEAEPKHVVQ